MATICGAWGGCPLPKGHNMGKADVPENHARPEATAAKWTMRDHDRHAHDEMMRHSGEMRTLELARIASLALVEQFPDMVSHFDVALAVIRALDEDGIVFARMTGTDYGRYQEEQNAD